MNVTIFGSGYVGLVTGVCLADVGHDVVCVDIDENKINNLKQGIIPIYEPGLNELVLRNQEANRLVFTTSAQEGIKHGDIQFIAVGTPPDEDGSADLQYVLAVAKEIGTHLDHKAIIVNKSTVPVGTAVKVKECITTYLKQRQTVIPFHVVSNPEFLKEGAAIRDFMQPDRIVVGTDSSFVEGQMRDLYAPFNAHDKDRILFMDISSAELTKYAANAMLATKISFINEMAAIAERVGADISQVRLGIGSDERIGYHFISAGCGYGGSCFPKDVQALKYTAENLGYSPVLLDAVETVNERQKHRLIELLCHHFGGAEQLKGKIIALWGLAFKPHTDDMRAAPSRILMEELWQYGAVVQAYDPKAIPETKRLYGEHNSLRLVLNKEDALVGADALVVCTDWPEFKNPDFSNILSLLKQKVIIDGRNVYSPDELKKLGCYYYGIGIGLSVYQETQAKPLCMSSQRAISA